MCSWAFSRCSCVGYRTHLNGPNHMYFTYDRASGRFRPFIIFCVLRMIMAFAVLGVFSVVLRTVWGPFGHLCSSSWGLGGRPWRLPRCSWGPLASSPGALGRDLDLPSRHSELLRRPFTCARGSSGHFGTSPGVPRCDFDVWNGATELQTHDNQILVISFFIHFH